MSITNNQLLNTVINQKNNSTNTGNIEFNSEPADKFKNLYKDSVKKERSSTQDNADDQKKQTNSAKPVKNDEPVKSTRKEKTTFSSKKTETSKPKELKKTANSTQETDKKQKTAEDSNIAKTKKDQEKTEQTTANITTTDAEKEQVTAPETNTRLISTIAEEVDNTLDFSDDSDKDDKDNSADNSNELDPLGTEALLTLMTNQAATQTSAASTENSNTTTKGTALLANDKPTLAPTTVLTQTNSADKNATTLSPDLDLTLTDKKSSDLPIANAAKDAQQDTPVKLDNNPQFSQTPIIVNNTMPQTLEMIMDKALNKEQLGSELKAAMSSVPGVNANDTALLQMMQKTQSNILAPIPQPEKFAQPVMMHENNWSQDFNEKMVWLSGSGVNTAHVQVDPPELGRILAHIKMENNNAEITLIAANSQVRDNLENNVDKLRESFQQAGYNLVNVNIQQQTHQQQSEQYQRAVSWSNTEIQPDVEETVTVVKKGDGLIDYYA